MSPLLLLLLLLLLQDQHHSSQLAPASESSLQLRINRLKHAKATGRLAGRVYTSRCAAAAVTA
jgi:hypothetical protein